MQQNDEDRFADFARAHSASLLRTAFLMTGDYQRAEDLLQTTLVRLYQRWARVEAMDRPVGYARKVLVSQTVSWWRRRSSHELPSVLRDELAPGDSATEVAEHERVWAAILMLPPRRRAVTVLRYDRGSLRGRDRRDAVHGSRDRQEPRARSRTADWRTSWANPRPAPGRPAEEATS